MFNATKFVIAGVIVALFGGLLLSGCPDAAGRRDVARSWRVSVCRAAV
jgi:hypothetical protein